MKKQKTKKELLEEIDIPSGIDASLKDGKIIMKKDNEEITRKLNPKINVRIEKNKIILSSKKSTRKEKKIFGSIIAHIKNIISGLGEKFKYKLQVANVHFPMSVAYDKSSNELVVKNFLGEKKDRKIKLTEGVDVKVNKDIIEIESSDVEKAGQAAANIEKGTKVRNRDRRIFQDGIFIIEKPGVNFI